MSRVWNGERTWLDPVLKPVEAVFYRAAGVDPKRSQGWLGYAGALLAFNAAGFVLLYAILRLQGVLPMNPQGFAGVSPHLAFNTAVSFVTNTNWQSYGGETTLSTFTQMVGLTVQNFVSAATGATIAARPGARLRRQSGRGRRQFLGRPDPHHPLCAAAAAFVLAVVLSGLGVVQSLAASVHATTVEGGSQTLPLFPAASQVAIKQLGINGGGVFNVNGAHPFENPSPLTNLITAVAINLMGWAAFFAFGRSAMAGRDIRALVRVGIDHPERLQRGHVCDRDPAGPGPGRRPRRCGGQHGGQGGPLRRAGVDRLVGRDDRRLERFGQLDARQLYAAGRGLADVPDATGRDPAGRHRFGHSHHGVMALLSVFVAGLMVGRTPEYLGKKIEAREIQFRMIAVLVLPLAILGFSAVSAVFPTALEGLLNDGPHGLSEILYAYTSAAANNGSAFAGLTANAPWWNTTLGIAMLAGRFRARHRGPGHRRLPRRQAQAGALDRHPAHRTAACSSAC